MNKSFYRKIEQIKKSSLNIRMANEDKKNQILRNLVKNIKKNKKAILKINQLDIKKQRQNYSLLDRLSLNKKRIEEMMLSLEAVIKLKDPIGEIIEKRRARNGLYISKVRVPIGVICIIYESRPNVTIEVASLCLKTGNCAVLKGGRDAYNTNRMSVELIQKSLVEAGLPKNCVEMIDPYNRKLTSDLLKMDDLIDVIIPRGGENLIKFVRKNSVIPVIETGAGVCHTYVEKSADLDKAVRIVFNAKTQRPTVCNALDTLVVDRVILKKFLPLLSKKLLKKKVLIKADYESYKVLKSCYNKKFLFKAKKSDFGKEFLSLAMSVKTVSGFSEAVKFIQDNSSGHSEAIVTEDKKLGEEFLKNIDAAAVFLNTSTRFTDGFQFGLGAEVGISTQKLHARGPMGLRELTSYKWVVRGEGQVRK